MKKLLKGIIKHSVIVSKKASRSWAEPYSCLPQAPAWGIGVYPWYTRYNGKRPGACFQYTAGYTGMKIIPGLINKHMYL